jgi:HK97 family phage major capsid protein
MSEMIKRLMAKLDAADERRSAAITARKALLDAAEAEQRADLTEDEATEFRAKTDEIKAIDAEITELRERVADLEAEEARTAEAAKRAAERKLPTGGAQVTSEELTYRKGNGNSYIRDLVQSQLFSDSEARERLGRHANEVKRAPEFSEVRAAADLKAADGAGLGGYFVPPAWLMNQWIELARPGRPTANLHNSQALPPGTDVLNIPKVLQGTGSPDVQVAEGDAVANGSWQDTSIAVPVRTVAGSQAMSQQLLDMSPLNFDQIIFSDLLADYAVKVDKQVLFGTGTNGQVTGLRVQSGATNVAVPSPGDQTGVQVYSKLADVIQQIHNSRFQSPEVIVMHPRRWAWFTTQLDTTNRPLVVPRAYSHENPLGTGSLQGAVQGGPVGDIMGIPVVLDPSIPTNETDAAATPGTTSDPILVLRPSDNLLYESSIRSRVLPEIKAQNLQVVVQVYGYIAYSAARYPSANGAVTKLVAPSF